MSFCLMKCGGIVKKTDKVPKKDIEKARAIMKHYFEQKNK